MSAYKFVDGYPQRGMDPEAVGQALDQLNDRHGGLTAKIVLSAAKARRSPMHNAFTWEDAEAAHNYRLRQAGSLIRAIVVENEDQPTVRRFVNVIMQDQDEATCRHYMTLETALRDEQARKLVLAKAKEELDAFRRKYANLKEFAAVIDVINAIV